MLARLLLDANSSSDKHLAIGERGRGVFTPWGEEAARSSPELAGWIVGTSTLARLALTPNPPVTSTLPLESGVAVCSRRGVARLAAGVLIPLAEWSSSALIRLATPSKPPATITLPLGSKVCV